jgi:hypothetical protein
MSVHRCYLDQQPILGFPLALRGEYTEGTHEALKRGTAMCIGVAASVADKPSLSRRRTRTICNVFFLREGTICNVVFRIASI